jgi:ABC-type nitrate/sulfonate/bicarbonate transport system permease component
MNPSQGFALLVPLDRCGVSINFASLEFDALLMTQWHSFFTLLGFLLHCILTTAAAFILYFSHVLFERVPHWIQMEDPIGVLVMKGLGYLLLGLGAVCCASYFWVETVKFFKQLSNHK